MSTCDIVVAVDFFTIYFLFFLVDITFMLLLGFSYWITFLAYSVVETKLLV